jgi:hypothetical protein
MLEVATQCLQCVLFFVDLAPGSDAHLPKHRKRWAPTLGSVLEEEPEDDCRQHEKAATDQGAENYAGQRDDPGVRLEISLDVPLALERADVATDRLAVSYRIALETLLRVRVDASVLLSVGMSANTIGPRFMVVL